MLTVSYARREIAGTIMLGAALTLLVAVWAGWWAIVPALAALALLSFYRDPRREIPAGDNLILAPADGRIVAVTRAAPGAAEGERELRIMIFLAIYNVHVNRSPCAGRVRATEYRPGRFVSALRSEANECNECNTIVVAPAPPLPGPIRVRQIAGVLARRIVCTVRAGDALTPGQRVGMIKLGSRTELALPEDAGWEVLTRVGDRVQAGRTVLARLRDAAAVPTGRAEPNRLRATTDNSSSSEPE